MTATLRKSLIKFLAYLGVTAIVAYCINDYTSRETEDALLLIFYVIAMYRQDMFSYVEEMIDAIFRFFSKKEETFHEP